MTLASPLIEISRQIGRYEYPVEGSRACAEAARNYAANSSALESVWPRSIVCLPDTLPELEWLYARDGALSARHVDGQWLGRVSVPARAAAKMLGKAVVTGPAAVLLAPTHAQQIRVALDRMNSAQALLVVIPGEFVAGAVLACLDFTTDIRSRRLWLAIGPDWPEEFAAILEANEGIAPPSMMIRVPGLNSLSVERVQKLCEPMIAAHHANHRTQLSLLLAKPRYPRRPPAKVCFVTRALALWDDSASLLRQVASRTAVDAVLLDLSDPTQGSALKFARTVDGCDALVTTNLARTDLPNLVPPNVPWITWITDDRIPAADPGAPLDRLIVTDASRVRLAVDSGWDAARVHVGQEPDRCEGISRGALPAIIADVSPVSIPRNVEEMSSQRLVWERVEHDVMRDPLVIGPKPLEYLNQVAAQIGLARDSIPIDTFARELLTPLFIRSLARLLASRGVKFAIYGSGWDAVEGIADRWRGPITNETELTDALSSTSLLIDVWPGHAAHAARRAGRPVLRPWGRDFPSIVRELNRASLATLKPRETKAIDLQAVLQSV